MPTLYEWEQALLVERHVRVESSAALLRDVSAKQAARTAQLHARGQVSTAKPKLITYGPFEPERDVYIRPVDLLHALGKVTTPPMPNLVDICSWWAYYRYLWAFAPPHVGVKLRLSREAKEIDFHQKGLLSDEMGVGMAAYLMATFCNAPQSLDVDVAIRRRLLPVTTVHDVAPDYIFFDAAQTTFFVVECKGTQTSRANAMKQLVRGCEQVPSLQFTDGTIATALVVATHLSEDATNTYVLDPPPDDHVGDGSKVPDDPEQQDSSKPIEVAPNRWEVRDLAAFRRATQVGVQARLLAFAGDEEGAANKLREILVIDRSRRMLRGQPPQVRETEQGEFVGTTQVLPTRDAVRLEAFHGTARPLIESSMSGDVERFREEALAFQRRVQPSDSAQSAAFVSSFENAGDALTVSSVSAEGTMLSLRVTPR